MPTWFGYAPSTHHIGTVIMVLEEARITEEGEERITEEGELRITEDAATVPWVGFAPETTHIGAV